MKGSGISASASGCGGCGGLEEIRVQEFGFAGV